jgi:hypothetical protein
MNKRSVWIILILLALVLALAEGLLLARHAISPTRNGARPAPQAWLFDSSAPPESAVAASPLSLGRGWPACPELVRGEGPGEDRKSVV